MAPRIFIIDDEAPARARLRDLLSDIAADFPHQLVGESANPAEALARLNAEPADIVLLDVQMPGMNGIELARHLLHAGAPRIIFVTAHDEFAVHAFEVRAVDYLLKPVRAARLLDSLRRVAVAPSPAATASAQQSIEALATDVGTPGARDFIAVQERGRVQLVPVADILYFKAELKYVTIRVAEREYLTEESLVALEDEFAGRFVRVHRNALVARAAISGFERVETIKGSDSTSDPHWEVVLRGLDERLPVSRRQWPVVKALVKPQS